MKKWFDSSFVRLKKRANYKGIILGFCGLLLISGAVLLAIAKINYHSCAIIINKQTDNRKNARTLNPYENVFKNQNLNDYSACSSGTGLYFGDSRKQQQLKYYHLKAVAEHIRGEFKQAHIDSELGIGVAKGMSSTSRNLDDNAKLINTLEFISNYTRDAKQ